MTDLLPQVSPTPTTTEHLLHVLDHTGDTRTTWDPDKQVEVDAAKKTFKELKKKGYLAYTVGENGEKGEVIQQFDPTAGMIIMSPQYAGG